MLVTKAQRTKAARYALQRKFMRDNFAQALASKRGPIAL